MKLRGVVIGVVVLAAVVGAYYVLQGTQDSDAAQKAADPAVSALPAVKASSAIIADAKVVPVKSVELSLPVGGIVDDVLVSQGDQVRSGQTLVRLDARQHAAAVAEAESSLARAKAALARSKATLAQLKAGPRQEDIAPAQAAVKTAEAELARLQKGADQSQIIVAATTMAKAERAMEQAQFLYDQVKNFPDAGASVEGLKLEQATLDHRAAKAQYEQLKAGPSQAEIGVAQARIDQAHASLAQLQASARPEAVAIAEADAAAADADVALAEAGLIKAKDALAKTELRAPFAGTIFILIAKPGELASPNSFLVRLADVSGWQVETQNLTELSVGRIREGDAVSIKVDAIPDLKLSGKVSRIGQFGTSRQGDIVYTVYVKLDQQDARLRWNMTASVTIAGVQR